MRRVKDNDKGGGPRGDGQGYPVGPAYTGGEDRGADAEDPEEPVAGPEDRSIEPSPDPQGKH